MTTSCPAAVADVSQALRNALDGVTVQLVVKGWRAGLSWSLTIVATAHRRLAALSRQLRKSAIRTLTPQKRAWLRDRVKTAWRFEAAHDSSF